MYSGGYDDASLVLMRQGRDRHRRQYQKPRGAQRDLRIQADVAETAEGRQ